MEKIQELKDDEILDGDFSKNSETKKNIDYTVEIPLAPTDSKTKYWILLISSLLLFGDEEAEDLPFATKTELREDFKEDFPMEADFNVKFDLLYSFYRIPNIFLPFINGEINDMIGDKKMLFILAMFIFIGCLLSTIGCFFKVFTLIIVGRAIFGIGGDSITSAQWAMVLEYFAPEEIGKILGFVYIFTNLGSALNFELSPIIAKNFGTKIVFAISTGITMICILFNELIYILDKRIKKLRRRAELLEQLRSKITEQIPDAQGGRKSSEAEIMKIETDVKKNIKNDTQFKKSQSDAGQLELSSFSLTKRTGSLVPDAQHLEAEMRHRHIINSILTEHQRNFLLRRASLVLQSKGIKDILDEMEGKKKKTWRDFIPKKSDFDLGILYWYNAIAYFLMIFVSTAYFEMSNDFEKEKWYQNESQSDAQKFSDWMNLLWTISCGISIPILGCIVDKFAFHHWCNVYSGLASLLSFLLELFIQPIIPTVVYSFSNSFLYAGTWSCVSQSLPQKKIGMGMGMIESLSNLFTTFSPQTVDGIKEGFGKYEEAIYVLMAFTFVGIVSALFEIEDKRMSEKYIFFSPYYKSSKKLHKKKKVKEIHIDSNQKDETPYNKLPNEKYEAIVREEIKEEIKEESSFKGSLDSPK